MNQVSTLGSFLLGASMLPFFWNVYKTWRYAPQVTVDTRGVMAARWSGPRAARCRDTTSPRSPGSARSPRRSTCATPRSARRTWRSPTPRSSTPAARVTSEASSDALAWQPRRVTRP